MEDEHWILDVLNDLETFAAKNKLLNLREVLADCHWIAASDLKVNQLKVIDFNRERLLAKKHAQEFNGL